MNTASSLPLRPGAKPAWDLAGFSGTYEERSTSTDINSHNVVDIFRNVLIIIQLTQNHYDRINNYNLQNPEDHIITGLKMLSLSKHGQQNIKWLTQRDYLWCGNGDGHSSTDGATAKVGFARWLTPDCGCVWLM